ncbi:MAG: hypothetical protein JSV80_07920, partial [Acidobacteriota bacterium]
AILFYQQDQGKLPTKLEELDESGQNRQRFIRKLYLDPMTRAESVEDWCLVKVGAAGRVFSSCQEEGDPAVMGLGKTFRLGEAAGQPRSRGTPATQGGIVGVHSKSTERAFNTVKRGEETYDRWLYTTEDYEKEVSMRSIPGLPQAQQPGIGGKQGQRGPQQPGATQQTTPGRDRPARQGGRRGQRGRGGRR